MVTLTHEEVVHIIDILAKTFNHPTGSATVNEILSLKKVYKNESDQEKVINTLEKLIAAY